LTRPGFTFEEKKKSVPNESTGQGGENFLQLKQFS
jgi:hypothetical protein